jgi:predicted transcriptional regulator YdeE
MVQQILSEEFRRMQKLAGIITEGDENFITLAINYNTDQDDLDYIAGILKKAGITSTVTTDKEVKIKINKADKDKLAKVLRKNGFELIDPT